MVPDGTNHIRCGTLWYHDGNDEDVEFRCQRPGHPGKTGVPRDRLRAARPHTLPRGRCGDAVDSGGAAPTGLGRPDRAGLRRGGISSSMSIARAASMSSECRREVTVVGSGRSSMRSFGSSAALSTSYSPRTSRCSIRCASARACSSPLIGTSPGISNMSVSSRAVRRPQSNRPLPLPKPPP
jgi:hypothetical protein